MTAEKNQPPFASLILEKMREKNLDRERLSHITGISDRYITLMLEENTEKFPPSPYVRGYLLKVGKVLDLDGEELWQNFRDIHARRIKSSGEPDRFPENRFHVATWKPLFAGILVVAVIGGIIIARVISVQNPNLTFQNLAEDVTIITEKRFTVLGTLEPAYALYIEGEQVFVDEKGNFKKELALEPGINAVTFTARGFLGKENTTVKNILYDTPVEAPGVIREEAPPAATAAPEAAATTTAGEEE